MGLPPLRIELLTKISGVEFENCRSRCETLVESGVSIPVIALEDLITNKKASARPKDLADLDALES
jgi:hypothetical protein